MKKLTTDWNEALNMMPECRIPTGGVKLAGPSQLQILLQDPMGQEFTIVIEAKPQIGLNGNMLVATGMFSIDAMQLDPSEREARFGKPDAV